MFLSKIFHHSQTFVCCIYIIIHDLHHTGISTENNKLIRRWLVVYGCIDGYCRCIMYLKCSTNNTGETVLQLFTEAVKMYNMPLRVRMDQGTENTAVARSILDCHGTQEHHVITGSSVHNQRIEHLWRDLNENVTRCYRNLFYYMEENTILDPLSKKHFYASHYVYVPPYK